MIIEKKFVFGLSIRKIVSKFLVGFFALLFTLTIFAVNAPVNAHNVNCWGHSSDWKSSGNYKYEASTQCAEKIYYVSVTIYLQQYDWTGRKWVDVRYLAGGGNYNTNFYNFMTQNGFYVPPYNGINCRRIKTYHGVSHDGIQRVFTTYSQGQCF